MQRVSVVKLPSFLIMSFRQDIVNLVQLRKFKRFQCRSRNLPALQVTFTNFDHAYRLFDTVSLIKAWGDMAYPIYTQFSTSDYMKLHGKDHGKSLVINESIS